MDLIVSLRLDRERRVLVPDEGLARRVRASCPGVSVTSGAWAPGADAYLVALADPGDLDPLLDALAAAMGPEARLVALVPVAGAARPAELCARVLAARGFRVTRIVRGDAEDAVEAVVAREPCGV